jgi:beta-N-acetylhexosaminidase
MLCFEVIKDDWVLNMNMKDYALGPLIADIEGIELSQDEKEVLLHPKLGGLIFFARNFESPEQLDALVRCIREVRSELLLCVDQEGGRVQRFKTGFSRIPPMGKLGDVLDVFEQHGNWRSTPENLSTITQDLGWLMATELAAFDIDHSFAPVLDLDQSASQVIGDRSFSEDPKLATNLASHFISGMNEAGMSATAKHFPGHGGVVEDSHLELPVDRRSFDEIQQRDMLPFENLKHEYAALMTAHIQFSAVDDNPVSFSSHWLKEILRDQIGFSGVVLSDDLSMKGAAESGDFNERSEKALNAGCDAILICNEKAQAEKALEFLERKDLGEQNKLQALKRRADARSSRERVNEGQRKHRLAKFIECYELNF